MVVIVGERAVNLERVSTVHIVSGVITMSDGHEFRVLPAEAAGVAALLGAIPLRAGLALHAADLRIDAATSKDGVWNVEYARRAEACEAAQARLPAGVPLSPLARRVSPLGVWEEAGEE